MFDIFKKEPKIELISIHIPKTAGTSFRNILKSVYGRRGVVRVDIVGDLLNPSPKRREKRPDTLPRGAKVLHGHFKRHDLMKLYNLDASIPVITWLRDPVERVVSNYFYLQSVLREHLRNEDEALTVLKRMQKSLIEYARSTGARNRMTKFLSGTGLDELFFVGITEHFDEDMEELARLLEWPQHTLYRQNATKKKEELDEEVLQEIRELNNEDAALYEEALALRKARGANR